MFKKIPCKKTLNFTFSISQNNNTAVYSHAADPMPSSEISLNICNMNCINNGVHGHRTMAKQNRSHVLG
jgi:hypothetical protein